MSDSVKPARMLIGGPSGCVGYTQEELRVLDRILNSGVPLRNSVVHSALRIMCQAVIQNPSGGYPSSLWELERVMGVQSAPRPPVPNALVDQQAGPDTSPDIEGTPDWMIESQQNSHPAPESVPESKPQPEPEPEEESDPEVLRQRQAVSAFMG